MNQKMSFLSYSVMRTICSPSKASKQKQFTDWKKVVLKAGKGGDGNIHFRRLKFRPRAGPDGGSGGSGGSIVFVADSSLKELAHVKKFLRAEDGGDGKRNNCMGKNANNLVIKVPVGTVLKEGNETLADLAQDGQEAVGAHGGLGGIGNAYFKTPTDQAPARATEGTPGEEKVLEVELKTIADVGLVGFPNAGKSTLLRAISRARPAVAAYPFTTLNPHVGMVEYNDHSSIAVADIPGLIVGAHLNKGLGHSFLRHIERCRCLLYVLDISHPDPQKSIICLQEELELYRSGLSRRPAAIVANKVDLVSHDENIRQLEKTMHIPIIPVSAKLRVGLFTLRRLLKELFEKSKTENATVSHTEL